MLYRILIILLLILTPVYTYALEGTFILDQVTISNNRIDVFSGTDLFYSESQNLIDSLKFAYQSGHEVILDYELNGLINAVTIDSQLYPIQDFSKIVSFLLGGVAAFALCLGISIKF